MDGIDLTGMVMTGMVVTADALHTTRDHATYLTNRNTHYVSIVKKNQHRPHGRLATLPRPPADCHTSSGSGHGRAEQRTLQVLTAPRTCTSPAQPRPSGSPATAPTAPPAPTKPTPGSASPTSPHTKPPPARITDLLRRHWHIENRPHWVRDVTSGEDHSHLRTACEASL